MRSTVLCTSGIVAALVMSSSANAGLSNCCTANGGLGCDDPACQEAVCAVDSFCCDVAWDTICAGEALDLCEVCQGISNCCIANGGVGCDDPACQEAVCSVDAFCCDVAWDTICAGEAAELCAVCGGSNCNDCCPTDLNFDNVTDGADLGLLLACWGPVGKGCECADLNGDGLVDGADLGLLLAGWGPCPDPAKCVCLEADHDCCTTGSPGCSDLECCLTVCAADPFCCEEAWDGQCVGEAVTLCGLDCVDCPESDHDCFSTGGPGCTDLVCCEAVCAVDSFCCDVAWDGICVSEAFTFCELPDCPFECTGTDEGEPCGDDTNGGCNVPIIGDSNCCFASGGLGCDDPDCTAAVCAVDPFCCDVAWDGICASEALQFCSDICQQGEPQFGSISCGETICGTAWAAGGIRDTDWFQITFDVPTQVTFSIENQLSMVIGIVDTGGVPDCALAAALNPFAVSGFCSSASIDFCVPAGTWWFFAAPNAFDGFPCDSGLNQYSITLECFGECTPLACGNAGHDCFTTGGPFCDDVECCETVCAVDPFCCDVAWDGICVTEAQNFCVSCPDFACDGTDEGEPCGTDTNGGCNSAPPIFGSIACGETICGTGWADGGTRDTDWYQIEIDANTEITITAAAQFPFVIGVVDTGGVPDCALATTLNPFATGNACAEPISLTGCLSPGTWWLFIAPNAFAGFPCQPDDDGNKYSFSLTCGGKCEPPVICGNPEHDCFTTGTPGCSDVACCETVCAIDPFCCDVSWDGICVQEAIDFCGAKPIANDLCADAIEVGLGSTDFTTIGAATDGPALPPECEEGFGLAFVNDIWYTYTPASGGTLTVSLCGSGYDTRLAVYTGECAGLSLEACNDDACGGTLQSEVSLPVSAGETYTIRVGGFSGSGTGTMTLSQ